MMKMKYSIREIREHFFKIANWVSVNDTCDVIYKGNPDRKVSKIGVGWSCCSYNLEAAANNGCELFVSHEGLFHGKLWAADMDSEDTPWGRRRIEILEKSGMACMRLHDTWDNFPEYGIRESWRRFLGLGELLAERSYHYPGTERFAFGKSLVLSRIERQSLGDFAKNVAMRCRRFHCFQGVTVYGELDEQIETVATGVGCHIPTLEMLELGADVLIVTFDRALQETVRIPLAEMGANIIALEHGVSEMPGMESLSRYIEQTFRGTEAMFYCNEPKAITIA